MRLGDIYKHKNYNKYIRIDSFATHIDKLDYKDKDMKIIVNQLQIIDDNVGMCPSFNQYGTQEEIEQNYELVISSELPYEQFESELSKLKLILEGDESV